MQRQPIRVDVGFQHLGAPGILLLACGKPSVFFHKPIDFAALYRLNAQIRAVGWIKIQTEQVEIPGYAFPEQPQLALAFWPVFTTGINLSRLREEPFDFRLQSGERGIALYCGELLGQPT